MAWLTALRSVLLHRLFNVRSQPWKFQYWPHQALKRPMNELRLQPMSKYTSGQRDPCDISVQHVQRFSGCFNDTHGKVQGTQSRSTAKWLRTRHKISIIAPDSGEDARLRTLS
ncbi:hypothetical protein KC330_g158 [Hortaea werneckii]|nr:hypothetical protein KC330_g158 [Hortaea werneckii]